MEYIKTVPNNYFWKVIADIMGFFLFGFLDTTYHQIMSYVQAMS